MAKKWIGKAVKHEGRLSEAAKRNGISKLQQAEKWSHSSDPSKRGAGQLGKRFIKGKLHTGGVVPESGAYELQQGETVIPAGKRKAAPSIPDSTYKKSMGQSAPNAPDPTDMPEGRPNAGARSVGKDNSGEFFKYKFSTNTVKQAQEVPGARKKAFEIQEGTNLSRLPDATPPGGSAKEK